MKKLFVIAAALLSIVTGAKADTSYLLIQGPFGAGGAEETFKWQVNYQTGQLITGQDLLYTILGTPTLSGTYSDANGTFPNYVAGNATQGASYLDHGWGISVKSFTLASTTVAMDSFAYDPSTWKGWNFYAAGGGGAWGSDGAGAPYTSGTWTFSNDGFQTRTLSDGSYDAWVFGSTDFYSPATVEGSGNSPSAVNFAGATVAAVPEPGSVAFMILGAATLVAKRRFRRS